MLIGSGLLAQAFAPQFERRKDVCIYAAGVSNSGCTDADEFARERKRLSATLDELVSHNATLVYFGTCSVADAEAIHTAYVQHKLAMERIASTHPPYLILRLPQVAGKTSNPHTLLNFLYSRISRSEAFELWSGAKRNIIDVSDVVAITNRLLQDPVWHNRTLNVANPISYSMIDIVHAMERVVGKRAIYQLVERGSTYTIDTAPIRSVLEQTRIGFDGQYLDRVIGKYYGAH